MRGYKLQHTFLACQQEVTRPIQLWDTTGLCPWLSSDTCNPGQQVQGPESVLSTIQVNTFEELQVGPIQTNLFLTQPLIHTSFPKSFNLASQTATELKSDQVLAEVSACKCC